jgi:hypothetical protein
MSKVVCCDMRTTVRLDEGLLHKAKQESARRGETVTALIERGLRLVLAASTRAPRRQQIVLPESPPRRGKGTRPGVDLDDSAALLDILEGRR